MEEEFNLIKKIEGIIKDLEWAIIYDKKIRSNEYCKGEIHGLKLALDLNKELFIYAQLKSSVASLYVFLSLKLLLLS